MLTDIRDDEIRIVTRNGRDFIHDLARDRYLPVVSGGSEPSDPPPDLDEGNLPKTFTQADLDRHAGRRAAEAKTAAERAIAEQLGVTVEEAKTIIAARKAEEDGKKTEADRALEAAKTAQADADRARTEAAADRLAAKVERKLAAAGASARAARMLDLPFDADDTTIDAEIEALKEDMPALFTATSDGEPPKPPPPGGGPAKKPPAGGQTITTSLERGKALAQKRHPQPRTAA